MTDPVAGPARQPTFAVRTTVFTCYSCGAWFGRIPDYDDLGKGDQCQRCGSTGFKCRPGRPIGPRSRYWPMVAEEVRQMRETFKGDDYAMSELNRSLIFVGGQP